MLPGNGRTAVDVANDMLASLVIVRPIGEATLACCPPLVMSDAEVERILEVYAMALGG